MHIPPLSHDAGVHSLAGPVSETYSLMITQITITAVEWFITQDIRTTGDGVLQGTCIAPENTQRNIHHLVVGNLLFKAAV